MSQKPAMKMIRFTIRTWLGLIAVIAILCAIAPTLRLLTPTFRSRAWWGGKSYDVTVIVKDRWTNDRPIAGASVLIQPIYVGEFSPRSQGVTGSDGTVRLTTQARADGRIVTATTVNEQVELWKTEHLSVSGTTVQVNAPGYQGTVTHLSGPPRSTLTVRLTPLDRPKAP